MADSHPAVTKLQYSLAGCYQQIGLLLWETGKPAEALAMFQSARAILQKLAKEFPAITDFQFDLAASHENIGCVLFEMGQPTEGLASLRAGRAILWKLADDNLSDTTFQVYLAEGHLEIGRRLDSTGQPAEGLASLQEALAIFQKAVAARPTVHRFRWFLAYCHTYTADALHHLGRRDQARDGYQAAIALLEVLVGELPTFPLYRSQLASALRRLGLLRLADGDPAGAAGDTRRALKLFDELPRQSCEEWFETACCHATLSALAGREGSGVPAADGLAKADQALALLKMAVSMGYRAATFQTETALDALRGREDFQKLRAAIEALNKADSSKDKQ
jgi:tetratricopeptide (TPR) repeat protein